MYYLKRGFYHLVTHEIGYIILDRYGDGGIPEYSWEHKGTSTIMTQK